MSAGFNQGIVDGDEFSDDKDRAAYDSSDAAYLAGADKKSSPAAKPDSSSTAAPDKDVAAEIQKKDEANRPMITSVGGALTNLVVAPAVMLKIFFGSTLSNMFKNISGHFSMMSSGVSGFFTGLLMIVKEIFSAVVINLDNKAAPSLLTLLVKMFVGGLPEMESNGKEGGDKRMQVKFEGEEAKIAAPGILTGFYQAFASSRAASATAQNGAAKAPVNPAPEGASPTQAQEQTQAPEATTQNKAAADTAPSAPTLTTSTAPSAPDEVQIEGASPAAPARMTPAQRIVAQGPSDSRLAAAEASRAAAGERAP